MSEAKKPDERKALVKDWAEKEVALRAAERRKRAADAAVQELNQALMDASAALREKAGKQPEFYSGIRKGHVIVVSAEGVTINPTQ